ncbi:MAG: hypothetical protein LWW98_08965 [Deltaproteobacteria bacterium]|nr:hypothetical protein [Deltaproteobacteria bacterium]
MNYIGQGIARVDGLQGILPAVDVGQSVSRFGGKIQLAAYRSVAGDLRLSYSQFEEMETFSRFGTRLDEETRKTLDRVGSGKFSNSLNMNPCLFRRQTAVLVALTGGIFDQISLDQIAGADQLIRKAVITQLPDLCTRIQSGDKLSDEDRNAVLSIAGKAIKKMKSDNVKNPPPEGVALS